MRPSQQDRPEVQAERAAFASWAQGVDPARVKVLDESGVVQGMRLGYGYAPRGQRCYDARPLRCGRRLNLIGWIGSDGAGVVALHRGRMDRPHFRGFVQAHLVPHLQAGDVVVWDNARLHAAEDVVAAIEARGARVKPLPRYSPDLSPMEPGWGKVKQVVRKARADTEAALEAAVAAGVSSVSASDAAGWFRHCGFIGPPD
jgi:transposase